MNFQCKHLWGLSSHCHLLCGGVGDDVYRWFLCRWLVCAAPDIVVFLPSPPQAYTFPFVPTHSLCTTREISFHLLRCFGHAVGKSPSRLLGTDSVCYHVPCGQLMATMEFHKRALLPPCLPLHYDPLEFVANSNAFINKVSHPRKISVLVYFCLPNTCRKY